MDAFVSSARCCSDLLIRKVRTAIFIGFILIGTHALSASISPARLQCEYLTDPLGIDTPEPRLSWMVESEQRAQTQTAYQIFVASSQKKLRANQADLWDSG